MSFWFGKDATAQGVAKQRLIETLAPPSKRVISDPYAKRFVLGASLIKLMGHRLSVLITEKFAPGFHQHLIARTRFFDDCIQEAVENGVDQYVILGAGYDLRAHRLDLPSSLRVFEVDQTEVQKRKRKKLPQHLFNSENVSYVSVDFNHQSLVERLLASGFDPNKPTIFTLEGVSQYITKPALASTIEALAALTHRTDATFLMSYVDERLNSDPKACFGDGYPHVVKRVNTIKDLSDKFGEPWVSFYRSDEIEQMLSGYGFKVAENKTLEDLNGRYFEPIGRKVPEQHVMKLEHFVVARA